MTSTQQGQRDTIITLLGRIEAHRRGIDADHLDLWHADMLILGLLGEYWQVTIAKGAFELTNAIADAVNAYADYLRAAVNQGTNE